MCEAARSSISARRCLWAASLFLLLAIVHTYPLITGLDHLSRHNDDEWLNAWTVSWIAHQLPRNPLGLFGANMYYPHEQSLAFTEPLIIPGLIGAPIHWLGSSPLLTYNVLLLLGMTLTGLAMYVLVVSWTGDHWSGLLSGALLAFGTAMLTRLPHLQAQHFYWLPLALLSFDNLVTRRRTRDAAWLGSCVLGAALTSGYTTIFIGCALMGALVIRAPDLWGREGAGAFLRLAGATVVTLALILVFLSPYREFQVPRPLPGASDVATTLQMYLASATNVHYRTWGQPFFERASHSFFPGLVALLLAAIALLTRRPPVAKGSRRTLVAVGMTGVVMSLGTLTPIYGLVYDLVPPVQSLRAPDRFGILAFFAVVALAGLGFAAVRQRVSPAYRVAVGCMLLIVATVESYHGPIRYRPVEWRLPIYRMLAQVDTGPVVKLPLHHGRRFNRNGFFLLGSTVHWRPMVNGYGNSRPQNFEEIAGVIARFPAFSAVARLRSLGVRYVVVHSDRAERVPAHVRGRRQIHLPRTDGRSDVVLIAYDGPDRLYRINTLPEIQTMYVVKTVEDIVECRGIAGGSQMAGQSLGPSRRLRSMCGRSHMPHYADSITRCVTLGKDRQRAELHRATTGCEQQLRSAAGARRGSHGQGKARIAA